MDALKIGYMESLFDDCVENDAAKSDSLKSFEGKSSGEKSSAGKSFCENQFKGNESGEINRKEIGCEKITGDGETCDKPALAGPGTAWIDTLNEETRKLLVNDAVSKLHYVWAAMKQRCYNPKSRNYKWYGARGIRVCKSWHRWQNFKLWALRSGYDPEAPYGECTLDRIDVDGDYEPSNCRWVSLREQMNNRQWNKAKKEEEKQRVSKYKSRAVMAVDCKSGKTIEFESVDAAARHFRPGRVESASSYIQHAINHGEASYKHYWKYKQE